MAFELIPDGRTDATESESGPQFNVNVGFIRRVTEFRECPGLQLSDAFLGHPHFLSYLLQGQRLVAAAQPETGSDDFLLALVQAILDF